MSAMPDGKYGVAIIGGGIIGASIAYHLAKKGLTDVVLLEREPALGMGSTAKAAGGIRAQFASPINIELSRVSIEHFERFPEEMGSEVVFNQVGYLWMATKEEEMSLFRENAKKQNELGVNTRVVTPEEIGEIAPYVKTRDLVGGTFHEKDGYAPPADYVTGYEKRARELGVTILTATEVTGLEANRVKTKDAEIQAEHIIVATGAWTAKIGQMIGLEIPIQPIRRQCFVTQPLPNLPHPIPMTVDYTSGIYMHSESQGLLIGKADKEEPPSFNETVDYRFMELIAELAMERVPELTDAEIKTGWGGLYEVTPDHHPIIGPVPDVPGLWIAAGFSGHGVMHAPATGYFLAEWIVDGKSSMDLSPLRLSRFQEEALIPETPII